MPLSQDDKDEIRLLIARELRDAVKGAVSAILNAPMSLAQARYSRPEDMQEQEARKQIVREIGDSVIKSVEAMVREADARIVEKTDPERADRIRSMVPEF